MAHRQSPAHGITGTTGTAGERAECSARASRDHLNSLRVLLMGAAMALAMFGGLVLSDPAEASIVWGCYSAPLGAGATPTSVEMYATHPMTDGTLGTTPIFSLSLTSYTGSIDWTPGFDVDSDGVSDYALNFQLHAGMIFDYLYYDTSTWSWKYVYENNAIKNASYYYTIFDALSTYAGIDYSTVASEEYTYNRGLWFDDAFQQMTFISKIYSIGGAEMPAGEVDVHVTVHTGSGDTDVSFGFDTTDVSGTSTAWPTVSTAVFLDTEHNELAALGTHTSQSATILPWGNLDISAGFTSLAGNPTDLQFEVGYEGELAESGGVYASVGFPGNIAVAAVQDCATNPHDDVLVAYDDSLTGGLAPDADVLVRSRQDADVDGTFDTTTTFLDATVTNLSKAVDARFWAEFRDVDGDGVITSADTPDVDGDGINDSPWNGITLTHQGDQAMGIDLTYGSQSMDTTDDFLMRVAADDIQANPELNFDYFGQLTGVDSDEDGSTTDPEDDTDGDGYPDEATIDAQQYRVRFCEIDFSTDLCASGTTTTAGEISAVATNEVTADSDGNLGVDFVSLGSTPQQLIDTAQAPVDPSAPEHWLRYESTESTGIWNLGAQIAGIEQGSYHLVPGDANDDMRVTLDASALGSVALVGLLHDADGSETDFWGYLHDVPTFVDVTIDSDGTDVDGDPVAADWSATSRTTAGFEVNTSSTVGEQVQATVNGWIGTGDGTADGLPPTMKISADLAEATTEVKASSSATAAIEAGLRYTTDDDRTNSMHTRAHAEATLSQFLRVYVEAGLERLEVDTCRSLPMGAVICPGPVTDIEGTVRYDVDDPASTADDAALTGVEMLPIPGPKFGVFYDSFGSDFEPSDEFVHYVKYDDTVTDEQTGAVVNEFTPWGAELALAELTRTAYAASAPGYSTEVPGENLFRQSDLCVTAEVDASHDTFGLGMYVDSLDVAPEPIYVNGELAYKYPERTLDLQAQIDVPNEAVGELGAMNDEQQAAASTYPLAETMFEDCPAFDSFHANDVAPLTSWHGIDGLELILQVRNGSFDELLNTIYLLEDPIISEPNRGDPYGIDLAAYSSESHAAFDSAAYIEMPDHLEVAQPMALTCKPGGNQDITDCIEEPLFDQEYTTTISAGIESTWGDYGDLDAEILSDTDDILDAGPVVRTDIRLDSIPDDLAVNATILERPRDGLYDVDATINGETGVPMDPITIEVRDELNPARFGDESESIASDPKNEGIPNYRVYFENLSDTLRLDGTIFTPTYGPDGIPAYEGGDDCSGTFGKPGADDHIYPDKEDPRDWTSDGPRTVDEIRPMYVHAEIDMNQGAEEIELLLDARTDSLREHRAYDNPRLAAKVRYESDRPTNVDVWALYPGMQEAMDTDKEWLGITVGRLESCIDIDIPIHLELDGATRISGGLDLLAAALTLDESEYAAGAHANVAFEERYWNVGGGWAALSTVEGIWAEELMTYSSALFDEYANDVERERMDVVITGYAASGSFLGTFERITSTSSEIDTDWIADFNGLGPWATTDTDGGGDERYIGAFALVLFHPEIANQIANDSWADIFSEWYAFNEAFDDLTDYVVDMDCSTDCGAFVDAPRERWTVPELDRAASVSTSTPGTLTGASRCGGSGTADTVDTARFGRLADGTDLEIFMRSAGGDGDGGRAEVYLVGYYESDNGDNDHVRFVQELFDYDTAYDVTTYCWQWRVSVNSLGVTDEGTITLNYDIERRRRWYLGWWGSWSNYASETVLLDPSGNMGEEDGTLTVSAATVSAGSAVTFTTNDAETTWDSCSFLPGDGTRVNQGESGSEWAAGDLSWSHTYDVPGTYDAMVFCTDEHATEGPGTMGQHRPLWGEARVVTVEVT